MRLLAAAIALAPQAAWADARWVEVEGSATVSDHVAPAQARRDAMQRARARAVAQVAGLAIRDEAFQVRLGQEPLRLFRETRAYASGQVVEETVLGWRADVVPNGANEPPLTRLTVKLRARVQTEQPVQAPFSVALTLPRTALASGEPMTMRVQASQPLHLHIFNLAADDRVYRIYPNSYVRALKALPGAVLTLPDPDSPFVLRPVLAPGHTHDLEALKVVATREPLRLPEAESMTLAEFYAWLLAVPADERAEATAEYTLHGAAAEGR